MTLISILVMNVRHLYAEHVLKYHVISVNIFTVTSVYQYVNVNPAYVMMVIITITIYVQSARQVSSVMFAKKVYVRNALIMVIVVVMVLQFVIVNIHGVIKHAAIIVHQLNFVVYVMNQNVLSILHLVLNAISKYAISHAHVLNVLMVNFVKNVSHIIVKNVQIKT